MSTTFAKHPTATVVTIYTLGVFLGLIHLYLGVIALTPYVSVDYHREMKITYNAFSKSLAFLHDFVDRATLALYMRQVAGFLQATLGSLLLSNTNYFSLGKIGNFGLIVLDINFALLQVLAGNQFARIAPTMVFAVLLVGRAIIVEQSAKRAKVGVKTRNAGKPKTSTPKKNKSD